MSTAIALSAGGARGAFEVGALKYLYQRVFVGPEPAPTIICGASAGSINAALLAQGGNALEELEGLWLGIKGDDDVYAKQPWLAFLQPYVEDIIKTLADGGVLGLIPLIGWDPLGEGFSFNDVSFAELGREINRMMHASSIYNLHPFEPKLRAHLADERVRASGLKLRLAVVSLQSGQLRFITEQGALVERDATTAAPVTVLPGTHEEYPAPCQAIANMIVGLEGFIAAMQSRLQTAATAEKGGIARAIRTAQQTLAQKRAELARCVEQHGPRQPVPNPAVVPLWRGVIASSGIPGIFEAQFLLGETYVDGGTREFIPIQAAIHLCAEKVFAIVCQREGVAGGFQPENIPKIAERAITIMIDELLLNELARSESWRGKPVLIIRNSVEVHGALEFAPGLLRINMDYGYLRAADVLETPGETIKEQDCKLLAEVAEATANARKLSDALTELRRDTYWLERQLSSEPGLIGQIRNHKRDIRNLVKQRLAAGLSCPPQCERWWLNWEWPVPGQAPTPWPAPNFGVPSACQALANTLATLEQEERDLQADLQEAVGAGMKASIGQRLRVKRDQIAQAKAALTKCIRQHTAVHADPVTHGLLVKGSSPKVFVVYGGAKLWIRSPQAMRDMGYPNADVLPLSDAVVGLLPEGVPVNGTLLQGRTGDRIFVMDRGRRRWITSPAMFEARGYSWAEVRRVPDDTLAAIAEGAPLGAADLPAVGIGDHFYTTSQVERDRFLLTRGYVSEGDGTECHVFDASVGFPGDHLYTTAATEVSTAVPSGYTQEGVACHVLGSAGERTSPLYRLYNKVNNDHFYTASKEERDLADTRSGYEPEGTACHVFAAPEPGTTPLYRLVHPVIGDHFYTINEAERNTAVAALGYLFEGVACHVFAAAQQGTLPLQRLAAPAVFTAPLHRLYTPRSGDHFYCMSAGERDEAVRNGGYTPEGEACHAFAKGSARPPWSAPLYRLVHPASGDHFYCISAAERDAAVSVYGYSDEGIEGYVFEVQVQGTVPLYRLMKTA